MATVVAQLIPQLLVSCLSSLSNVSEIVDGSAAVQVNLVVRASINRSCLSSPLLDLANISVPADKKLCIENNLIQYSAGNKITDVGPCSQCIPTKDNLTKRKLA